MIMLLLVLLFLVFVALSVASGNYWELLFRWRGRPPGPLVFPLGGSFHALAWHFYYPKPGGIHQAMQRLSCRYGPVMSLGLGPDTWVVLSSFDAIKEFSMMEEAAHRPQSRVFDELYSFGKPMGVIMADGHLWRDQRRFMLATMKQMGVGKVTMEDLILDEFRYFMDHLTSQISKSQQQGIAAGSHDLSSDIFDLPCLNVIWRFVSGKRFEYDDAELKRIIGHVEAFSMEPLLGVIVGIPGLAALPGRFRSIYRGVQAHMDKFKGFLTGYLRAAGDEAGTVPDCYIDAFLQEQRNDSGNADLSDEQLVVSLQDFFTGGSGTVAKTLSFALYYLSQHRRVLARVQQEVDAALGGHAGVDGVEDLLATLSAKDRLPYTQAVIYEVQRLASVLPIAPPRVAPDRDVRVGGYTIPRGVKVQMNLYAVHRDPSHWAHPDAFDPGRFFDEASNSVKLDEWLIPFGYGKRRCIGESLARGTVFVFLANFVHKFDLGAVNLRGSSRQKESVGGLTIGPPPFSVKIKVRAHDYPNRFYD